MKKIRPFLFGFLFWLFVIKSFAQQDQRIHAAYLLAFGRDASLEELNYWLGRGNFSIGQLIEFHREGFVEYPSLHRETVTRAYMDALGRKPSENEMKYWVNGVDIYMQLINIHLKYLKSSLAGYESVVRASYVSVFNREPDVKEINLWVKQPVMPFYLLISRHKNFLKKKTKEVTSFEKVNLNNLPAVSIIFLSPTIAAEASKFMNTMDSAVATHNGKQARKIEFLKKANINGGLK